MAEGFDVVQQEPTTTLNDVGRVEVATQVTFRTKPSQITGRIVIPQSRYTPDEVAQLVAAAAANLEQVQRL